MITENRSRLLAPFGLLIVWCIAAASLLRGLGNSAYQYPDADRILMDGVFLYDFLRDFAFGHLYQYTLEYYAQYPALSIGYRPPFFPFVESVFHFVFGVNTWSSRLAVFSFVVVGVGAWYVLIRRMFDTVTAFFTSLLLVTNPFFAMWGWYTMAELPLVSMMMLTAMVFHRYVDSGEAKYLYWTAFLLGLTIWTKQTAFYLVFWFMLYLAFLGRLMQTLKRKETWFAVLGLLAMVIPLAVITVWLGQQNLAQSIGHGHVPGGSRFSYTNLSAWLWILYHKHLPLPVFVLSAAGFLLMLVRRDPKPLFFVLLIACTYLYFTYILNKNARYAIFWIPAFALMATLPIYYLRDRLRLRQLAMLGGVAVVSYQGYLIYESSPLISTGYDEAAAYVLAHGDSPTVFFDGRNNGYFTYFMRALDPQRSMHVLRGEKLLSSSSISTRNRLQVHVRSKDDILKVLDGYGVEYVVVESENRFGPAPHTWLRELLKTDLFKLEKTVDVNSNHGSLYLQKLLVYKYLDRKVPSADYLELRVPVVGTTIRVPFRQGTKRVHSDAQAID